MPIYEYTCDRCGDFAEMHPIAQYADSQPCPGCGLLAERALTTPQLGAGTSEPAPPGAAGASLGRRHFGGCSCCGGGSGFRADPVPAG